MGQHRRLRAVAGKPRPWYHVGEVLALVEPPPEGVDTAPASTADVYVFDTIGGWMGVSADDFVRDVAALDVDQIVLHLNTPGGEATEGVAIANVLRAHRARVVVRVDGLAASAGSVIAMAGEEVVMGLGSQMMIHDPWTVSIGDAAEMLATQRMLDSTADAMADTYAGKAGGTAAQWREVMRAETWYTAAEAVAAGLADRVAAADETGTAEGEQVTPGYSGGGFWGLWDSLSQPDRFDLSAFTHAGRAHAPAPAMPGRRLPAASAAGRSTTERNGSMPTFLEDVQQRLGVAAGADEATILAALDEALDERAEGEEESDVEKPDEPAEPNGDDDEGADDDEADAAVKQVDARQLTRLQADARLGREAHARQQREDRERLVEAAVSDGRIAPASRDGWLRSLASPQSEVSARTTLAALEKGLYVGPAKGYTGDGGETAADPVTAVRQSSAYLNWSK
jgi:ATP-dependent protease ClpP protease subunit